MNLYGKRRKLWFFPQCFQNNGFLTMFSKGCLLRIVRTQDCVVKLDGENVQINAFVEIILTLIPYLVLTTEGTKAFENIEVIKRIYR